MKKVVLGAFLLKWSKDHLREWMRISLGVIFLWFGALKVFNVSPVYEFVVTAYPIFSFKGMFFVLGLFEVIVGTCLLLKVLLRQAEIFILVHLAGTLLLFFSKPEMAFSQFPILTLQGEFLLKNLALGVGVLYLIAYEK